MKTFILVNFFISSLLAESVVKKLTIQEGGMEYTQTVTLDFERNIQILEVPSHNNIVHSRTIFDFNNGLLVESHPNVKKCYIHELPKSMASMEKFSEILSTKLQRSSVDASKAKTSRRHYEVAESLSGHNLAGLAPEIVSECQQSKVFTVKKVENVDNNVSQAPQDMRSLFMGMVSDAADCTFYKHCLWQTCEYGSDSCWWTVNCPDENDESCEDWILEHSSINHQCEGGSGDCQINCHPCYNMECPSCSDNWATCESQLPRVTQCPADGDYGNGCDITYCPPVDDDALGTWDCTEDKMFYEEGDICLLKCTPTAEHPSRNGGFKTCSSTGKWKESETPKFGCV